MYQVDFIDPFAMIEAVRKGGMLLREGKDGKLGCREVRALQLRSCGLRRMAANNNSPGARVGGGG